MYLNEIDTPALLLDKKLFEKNLAAMDRLLAGSSLSLRPHYKSHKCAAIAQMQISRGAVGVTCAKLSEAADLCDCGIENILIANQITEPSKIRRLADLAAKCCLTVCVDNKENIDALSLAAKNAGSTVHCYIEYEIGMMRCGVLEDSQILELARYIAGKENLTFDGIQAYAGHISHMEDAAERAALTEKNAEKLRSLLNYLAQNGITVKALSGGSTGTASLKAPEGLYTELQAGSYLFMDATYAGLGLPFENSLSILSTVVSVRDGLAVVDCGVKTCGVDQGMPVPVAFAAENIVASEEHFQLHKPSAQLRVGDKVRLVPAHCCSTVNLYDRIYVVDGDKVTDRLWITGRGYGK